MKYVGIDLHKKTIVICVVDKDRKVLARSRFLCVDVQNITAWFAKLGEFQFVVEATATYPKLRTLPLEKIFLQIFCEAIDFQRATSGVPRS